MAAIGESPGLGGVTHVEHADDDVDGRDQDDKGEHDVVEDGGNEVVLCLVDIVRDAQDGHDDAVHNLRNGEKGASEVPLMLSQSLALFPHPFQSRNSKHK